MGCGASKQQVSQCTSDWYVCVCMSMCTCVYGLWGKQAAGKSVHTGSVTSVSCSVYVHVCNTHELSHVCSAPLYYSVYIHVCNTHAPSHVCSAPAFLSAQIHSCVIHMCASWSTQAAGNVVHLESLSHPQIGSCAILLFRAGS